MSISSRQLSALYRKSHDQMRNLDGLQPQEAFDELLKYLFMKESADEAGHCFPTPSLSFFNHDVVSSNRDVVEDLRRQLRLFLESTNTWSSELWQDRAFHLSDAALLGVHEQLKDIDFHTIDIDTRSAALNEFIPGELRKGLGIFPTPDVVARMMVEIASPSASCRVFDPACGTGTLLVETIRRWRTNGSQRESRFVWGVDKNPRMLLLSELNLGHSKTIKYRRALGDSLYQHPSLLFDEVKEGFDYILTNPPFGVIIDRDRHDMTPFQTCRNSRDSIVKHQRSEVVFIEQCLKYLKPGGLLGIVLPRSVVTNSSLQAARHALNSLGCLEVIVSLPPATFCASGTQTNTVVLFIRRYRASSEMLEFVSVISAEVSNVGFDSTGRSINGGQLEGLPSALKLAKKGQHLGESLRLLPKIAKGHSLSSLPELLSGHIVVSNDRDSMPLRELVEFACTGKTPSRANYSTEGLFLVKVGNLTGHGISWEARDRNFVSGIEACKRREKTHLMLTRNDILLTSSAHSPVYIAKKVDLVNAIPSWVGGEASFVGEVMLLRVKEGYDPMILLAYLRLPSTQNQIKYMIRGQTAHLHPKDLLKMMVPKSLIKPPLALRMLADRLKEESRLSDEMSEIAFRQQELFASAEKSLVD